MKYNLIDINALPQEVRDIIELREDTERTFVNFMEKDYTEIFFNTLIERSNPEVEHSMIISVTGMQGCHLSGTKITTNNGLKSIEEMTSNDKVWAGGEWRKCSLVDQGVQEYITITIEGGNQLKLTRDHRMYVDGGGWRRADKLRVGEYLVRSTSPLKEDKLFTKKGTKIVSIECAGERGRVYDLQVEDVHEYIANGLLSHNSGKSYSAISIARILNPDFNIETIFFDYNKLVYDRAKLKPNTVVLVDEQSQSYGLDSHRVMVILATLKEQLRKKSIHFIFCSPVLYAEAQSSMYILEMIFIDYSTQEAYGALKTREGLVLGHVRIPSPLKDLGDGQSLASKELIDAYQKHKDEHLERVLGAKDYDIFSDRAEAVMKHEVFKKAEKMYKKKMGYIPQNMLIQIINKIFPEFRSGVGAGEITARIKMEKEVSGEWEVAGRKNKAKSKRRK